MLTSRQPIWIGWGSELNYLYNDPYKSIIGGKHPWAARTARVTGLARDLARDRPHAATAMGGNEGTYVEAQLLVMERNGYPEETYYTFSYSPIPETTARRRHLLRQHRRHPAGHRRAAAYRCCASLRPRRAEARTWQQACERSASALSTNSRDLPFAMIYMLEPDGRSVRACEPRRNGSAAIRRSWKTCRSISSVPGRWRKSLPGIARGWFQIWSRNSRRPFPAAHGSSRPTARSCCRSCRAARLAVPGFLIAGLNPFRLFDDNYSGFMNLVAGQIAAAIANAEAYEQERHRAEALAEIDRAKTAFFSNVSHEFRTPLTLMLGPLEDALRKPGGTSAEAARRSRTVAYRNALRLLRLVNTLLDFSRVEAGRRAGRPGTDRSVPLHTPKSRRTSDSAVRRARAFIWTSTGGPLPQPVYVDRDMWEKIVLNLLSNAFKFTFAGGIDVRLREWPGSAELSVQRHRRRHSVDRVAAPVRTLPSRRGCSVAAAYEGSRHRTGPGARTCPSASAAKSRVDSDRRARHDLHGHACPTARQQPSPERRPVTAQHDRRRPSATAFVEEALRWLPRGSEADLRPVEVPRDATSRTTAWRANRRPIAPVVLVADDNADMRGLCEPAVVGRSTRSRPSTNGVAALAGHSAQAAGPAAVATS